MTRQQRWIIITLLLTQFTHVLDFVIMMPLSTHFIKSLQITAPQFTVLVASYGFSAAFSGFFSTMFTDKYDRKPMFTTIFIGFILSTFACGLASNYEMLILARIVTGIFGGILSGQTYAIVSDVFPYNLRARATGVVMSGFSLASAIGVPASLFFANRYGLSVPFYVIGTIGLLTLILIHLFIPNLKGHVIKNTQFTNPFKNFIIILKNKNQRHALLMTAFLILGGFPVITMLNPFLKYNISFDDNDIMMMYIIGGVLTIITANLIGYVADKTSKQKVFLIMGLLSIIPLLLMTNLTNQTTHFQVFIFIAFFFFVINGRNIPSIALSTSVAPSKSRGSYMGINSFLQQIAMGLSASISGLVVSQNETTHAISHYNYVGYISIGFTLMALYCSRKVTSIES